MSINKIIIAIGIILVIFITFIFMQFNPFGKSASTADKPAATVTIKNQTFNVLIAKTEEEKQKGLSGREALPQDQGMVFLFEEPSIHSFWMKDMKFPIDIIFINENKIVSIIENAKPDNSENRPLYQPTAPSNTVFEINAGLAKKYNFKPGDTVELKIP